MSDDLFNEIENLLAGQVGQTEDGRTIKTHHEGEEPPDDGNEWLRCETMEGRVFWVLAHAPRPPKSEDS